MALRRALRLIQRPMRCGPTDGCSPASQPESCRWRNATSCTEMTMQYATVHRPTGNWPRDEAAGVLTLDFDARHRRRICLVTDQGDYVLLDLPRAIAMADGDGLQLADGRWLEVRAAAELVVEVRHHDPDQLARWPGISATDICRLKSAI